MYFEFDKLNIALRLIAMLSFLFCYITFKALPLDLILEKLIR